MTLDIHADNSALLKTDFVFTYPSYLEGVPATLQAPGYGSSNVSADTTLERHARPGR